MCVSLNDLEWISYSPSHRATPHYVIGWQKTVRACSLHLVPAAMLWSHQTRGVGTIIHMETGNDPRCCSKNVRDVGTPLSPHGHPPAPPGDPKVSPGERGYVIPPELWMCLEVAPYTTCLEASWSEARTTSTDSFLCRGAASLQLHDPPPEDLAKTIHVLTDVDKDCSVMPN